jgi:hypothetical protein
MAAWHQGIREAVKQERMADAQQESREAEQVSRVAGQHDIMEAV